MTELPAGWCSAPLEALTPPDASIVYGIIQAGPQVPGGIPYVRPTELVDGGIALDALKRTSVTIAKQYERASLKAGDIILAIVGTIGKLAVTPPELDGANITQSSARVRPGRAVAEGFLPLVLKSPQLRAQFDRVEFGIAVRRLNVAHVRALDIPLPPLAEQRRIVAKLEDLLARSRRAKAALDAIPPLLEKLRQSVLAAAFRGDLTADWRAKNRDVEPAEKLLARIRVERRKKWEEAELAKMKAKGKAPTDDRWRQKYVEPEPVDASELPELPDGWCWASVEEVCPGDAPAVYGIIQPGDDVPGGIPYVRPLDMRTDGTIDFTSVKRTSGEIAAQYERASLRRGDIVLSIVGTIGKVIIVPPELDGGNITQSSARLRPPSWMSSEYLSLALQSPVLTRQYDAVRFGNAVQRLNVDHVRRLGVPIAPIAESRVVIERLREALAGAPMRTVMELRKRAASLTAPSSPRPFAASSSPRTRTTSRRR